MPFHDSYHLILSAPETKMILEENKSSHLSIGHAADATKRSDPRAICQIPKWVYHKQFNVDQVNLEVPGISTDDLAVFVSNRDLIVSAIRYVNYGNTRKLYCEYFFRMRLADDNDPDAVTFNYINGVLSINIPRIRQDVKKLVPAFLYNKKPDRDEIMLELVGVKSKDVKYDVNDRIITICARRFDMTEDVQTLEAEYEFTIRAGPSSNLSELHWILNAGIFKICIPCQPEKIPEIAPVHFHKKEPRLDIVVIELPGSRKEDIEMKATRGRLLVRANKYDSEDDQRILMGTYSLFTELPQNNDSEEMMSEFNDGILTLSFPRHSN